MKKCYPQIEKIATDLGVSEKSVRRRLKQFALTPRDVEQDKNLAILISASFSLSELFRMYFAFSELKRRYEAEREAG